MTTFTKEFIEGLALHVVDSAGGEAGRLRDLSEGVSIVLNYIEGYNTLVDKSKTPVTVEQLSPDNLSVPKSNPLVDLFYEELDDHF